MKSYLSSKLTRLVLSFASLLTALVIAASCNSAPPPGDARQPPAAGCTSGLSECSGGCFNLASDNSNCGTCGNACPSGTLCQGGSCTCQAGWTNCNGVCIPTQEDPNNCGTCGTICSAPTPFCSQGACSSSCAATETACGNACVDLNTSSANCGACSSPCGAGQSCVGGSCSCSNAAQISCGGVCIDPQTSSGNCGTCGNACGAGETCMGGLCQGGASATSATSVGGASSTTTTNASTTTTSPSTTTDATTTTSGGGASSTTTTSATTGGSGGAPPGYWTYKDWHGCVWTGIDSTIAGSTTSITPQDFTMHTEGDSYCVSGQVHDDYDAVALLGFNLAQDAAGADCTYDPAAAMAVGPPEVALTGQGLALNFTKVNASTTLRAQIQGSNGAIDANNRWCATIAAVSGKAFVPWGDFNTECWEGGNGSAYAGEPISAVVFLVPGVAPGSGAEPFEYCIHGFDTGSSADDAPDGGEQGSLMGEIGGPGSDDVDFQRVKVVKDGEEYIIQNNNWGNPGGSDQLISYVDNSFTIVSSTGTGSGANVVSFPSIYIGANGDTQGGTYSTSATDNLPKQLSSIGSVNSTFRWSGGNGGQYNVAYDIWFSQSVPSAAYDDGISGFVMLWFFDPSGSQPIGSVQRTFSAEGHTWDVWVGPRGGGGPNNNAPVVSYVAQGGVPGGLSNFDLMTFIRDAEQHGISQSWYLTDVFGGFEIWTGPDANGLKVDEFTAVVQ